MGVILDQWGKPARSSGRGLYQGGSRNANDGVPHWETVLGGIEDEMDGLSWETLVSSSRRLFANCGPVRGIILDKSAWAIGNAYLPKFMGTDTKYGEKATEWLLKNYYPFCNIRGGFYNFQVDLFIQSIGMDHSGDSFTRFIRDPDTGQPRQQLIPQHRVQSGLHDEYKPIEKGPYKGCSILKGVVSDRYDRIVGYNILGKASDGSQDEIVPSRQIVHLADPEWGDQVRGFPNISSAILSLRRYLATKEFDAQALMMAATVGLVEKNANGEAPTTYVDDGDRTGSKPKQPAGVTGEWLLGGTTRYYKANSGEGLETVTNNNPSVNSQTFQDSIVRDACLGNWPYEIAYDSSKVGTGNMHGIFDRANLFVIDRQGVLDPLALRSVSFAISIAEDLGELPPHKEHWMWGFTRPAKITMNTSRQAQQQREDYKIGWIPMSKILEDNGLPDFETTTRRRMWESATRKRIKREVEAATGETIDDDREIQMLTPNEQPAAEQTDAANEAGKTTTNDSADGGDKNG